MKGAPVSIVFQIENTTTDAVSGTWVGPAYGQIVFSKASTENQMWQFEPMGVCAQLNGGGVIDTSKTYAVVQNPSTGFIGVRSGDSGAFTNGTKIVIHGVFVGASTDTVGVPVTTGPITSAVPNGGISVK